MTFWTPEMIELASGPGDDESDAVVADWLEERGCLCAARCFRLDSHRGWRRVFAMLARTAPEVRPDGLVLVTLEQGTRLDQHVLASHQAYGFDISTFLPFARPLPALPHRDASEVET